MSGTPPAPVLSPSKIQRSVTVLSQYPYPWNEIASGCLVAPCINVSTYSLPVLPDPNWPPAVAGPTNFSAGSTANIAGTTAFHIVKNSLGVSAWPDAGSHGVSFDKS